MLAELSRNLDAIECGQQPGKLMFYVRYTYLGTVALRNSQLNGFKLIL